jgi:hypothetical protein
MNETMFDKALAKVPKYILNCPVFHNWVEYKSETYYAILNYEQSLKSKRAMIDLCPCVTKGMNGIVEKTVQYDRNKFKKSKLDN